MGEAILWLDNDNLFLKAHVESLKRRELSVRQVYTVSAAMRALQEDAWDLVILDVMLPVEEDDECGLSASDTSSGHETGLAVFRAWRDSLLRGIPVLVFTIRSDRQIRQAFLEAGLPEACFAVKTEFQDTELFVKKVRGILRERNRGDAHVL